MSSSWSSLSSLWYPISIRLSCLIMLVVSYTRVRHTLYLPHLCGVNSWTMIELIKVLLFLGGLAPLPLRHNTTLYNIYCCLGGALNSWIGSLVDEKSAVRQFGYGNYEVISCTCRENETYINYYLLYWLPWNGQNQWK